MQEPRWSHSTRTTLIVALVLAGQMAVLRLWVWHPDRDISFDAPYHVTMSDLFTQFAWRRSFPPMAMSVWSERFANKEIGFHLLLASVRRWAGMLGYGGQAPPFILESFVLLFLLTGAFLLALSLARVRQPFVFLPLLLFSCPLFTLRVNMVRPHVVSIVLMLLTVAVLSDRADERRQLWRLGILGALFSYCHSNPHFILIPAGCWALAAWPVRGWRALLPCVAAGAGVVFGLCVHPQVPNTFLIWKIQCVDVVLQMLPGRVADIAGPGEFRPPGLNLILQNIALPLLAMAGAGASLRQRWTSPQPSHGLQRFGPLLTMVCLAGFFVSRRMIEYALPFALLTAADAYDRAWGHRPLRFHLPVFAASLALGLALMPVHRGYLEGSGIPVPRQFAEWARASLAPGSRIANVRWDDFPPLFHAAPEYVYSYGLDPMFAYAVEPERFVRIERLSRNREPVPDAATMRDLLQARFAYLSIRYPQLARAFAARGFALAYQGVDGWCFDLDAPLVDHRLRPPAVAPEEP